MSIQVRVTADSPREAAEIANERMVPGDWVHTVTDRDTGQTTTVVLSK
jgi:hypothetical protein